MGLFGSSEPETPEEKLEKDEKKVVKRLKKLDDRLNEIFGYEKQLISALEDRKNESYVEEQLTNIEILLQDDIESGEKSLADEIQQLRDEEEKLAQQTDKTQAHGQLLNLVGETVTELHDEEQRLQELVQEGNKVIRSSEIDYENALSEMQQHIKADQKEAEDLQNKIHEAAKLERKIMEDN
jgi:DNA repair exonuclease SbcCD ATPase subunit